MYVHTYIHVYVTYNYTYIYIHTYICTCISIHTLTGGGLSIDGGLGLMK